MKGTAGGVYSLSLDGSKLVMEMDEVPKTDALPDMAGRVTGTFNSKNLNANNAEMFKVVTDVEPVAKGSRIYASAEISAANFKDMVVDGQGIQIGDDVYVFATKKSTLEKYSELGGKVIDMTDKKADDADFAKYAAERLSKAAEDNKRFKVGANPKDGTISITEKEGGVDYEVNNLAGADGKSDKNAVGKQDAGATEWKDLIKVGTAGIPAGKGKALQLQIGDTAEKFNQMKVNIGDCHAAAMGIGSISIADQDSAAAAMDAIKGAINYVSDVRGTLGATQNRLDHTINNLSVMQENIQDAESTIRDVDVAKEMMAYTKNNILVQSAQAMLAQANQLPQGVLQLLG